MSQRAAVFGVFAVNGAALGSWAPRVPALTEQVDAHTGTFGLALLGASVGMVLAASVSGRLVQRFGARAVTAWSGFAGCALLPAVGSAGSVALLGIALLGLGAAVGALDVGMNVAGVVAERRAGRSIMPVFHAGFAFGALIGSAAAGGAAAAGWSPAAHLALAGGAAAIVLTVLVRPLPVHSGTAAGDGGRPALQARPLARRPVLWLLAAVALCSAIAEGASADWSALLMVTSHATGEGAAALAYSGFALAMAITRLAGAWGQRRFGPTRLLIGSAAAAAAGLLAAALVPLPAAGYLGFALAGAGLAASFPVALSLAGEAGQNADGSGGEREIGFVTTIAYSGFLAGPPAIGGIARLTSLPIAFVVVAAVAAVIAAAALGARYARVREQARRSELDAAVR
ncbi:MFS transporter [Amycolatopsis antarctica]|uniref:MFS transporter n=1 Tax=Amycolatopsis antarctica TaxID=1854586 RepID=A0A263D2J4_9PSEU|nr:MFS transporter [Amycolatopsis antarctica]OZM71706.1 MFS transporter [Amycolatopsis antarctica]